MDPIGITSTFVILMESYCSQDGSHESVVATALAKEDAMRKILIVPHNGGECTCNFSTDVDGMEVSCFSYPMAIREFDLRTNVELSFRKFFNKSQVLDELDKITSVIKSTKKR